MKKFKQVSSDRHQMSLMEGSFPGLMSGGRSNVRGRGKGREGVGPKVYCPVGTFPGLMLGGVGPQ